ncbi:MAG: hypothetical protein AAGH99_04345 [Planctomycetota bacterium]
MSVKKVAIGLAIAVPAIVAILTLVADYQCRLRTHRLNAEIAYVLPSVSYLVNEYTRHFIEEGEWPAPRTIYDDSTFNYVSTRSENGTRIDTYETLSYRLVDVHLMEDGKISVYEVPAEAQETP